MLDRISTFLFLAFLASAACKPDPVEPTLIDHKFTITSRPDPDKVYQLGDTLDFEVEIKVGNYELLTYLLVESGGSEKKNYITNSYSDKADESGYKKIFSKELANRVIQDTVISYRYIINQEDSLESLWFGISAISERNDGTWYDVGIYGFSAYVNSLYVVDTFRIYNNYVGREIGPETITGYDLFHDRYLYGACVLNDACSDEQTPFAYMVNQTSRDNPDNLSFVRGWKAHSQARWIDSEYKYMLDVSEESDDSFLDTGSIYWEIENVSYQNRVSHITNVEKGDKFLVVAPGIGEKPAYYGLLRVIDVVDDGTAANQEDYIELVYYR